MLSFDGVDDYIEVSGFPQLTGSFTLEAYAYFATVKDGNLIRRDDFTNGYGLQPLNSQKVRLFARGTSGVLVDSTGNYPAGEWVRLSGVFNDSDDTLKVYIGGVLQGTVGATGNPSNASVPLRFGVDKDGGSAFHGFMRDLRIWSVARSASQIADFASPEDALSGQTGLLGRWKLDDGAGTTAADSSGNGYDGTISGATWVPPSTDVTDAHLEVALQRIATDVTDLHLEVVLLPAFTQVSDAHLEVSLADPSTDLDDYDLSPRPLDPPPPDLSGGTPPGGGARPKLVWPCPFPFRGV